MATAAFAVLAALAAVVGIQAVTDDDRASTTAPAAVAVAPDTGTTAAGTGHPGVLPGGGVIAAGAGHPGVLPGGDTIVATSPATVVDQQAQLQSELAAIRAGSVVPESSTALVDQQAQLQSELAAIRAGSVVPEVADTSLTVPWAGFGDVTFVDTAPAAADYPFATATSEPNLNRSNFASDLDWITANGWN